MLKQVIILSAMMITTVAYGQASSITISTRPGQNDQTGTTMEIIITNISKHEVFFPCADVSRLRTYVNKSDDGTLAVDTKQGAELKERQRSHRTSKSVCVSGALEPGQTVKEKQDLAELYELEPGKTYQVRMELDMPDGTTSKSPPFDLTAKASGKK